MLFLGSRIMHPLECFHYCRNHLPAVSESKSQPLVERIVLQLGVSLKVEEVVYQFST